MIEHLKIVNFKSHINSDIDFGKLTVVTGLNGSGKSAVIQSLLLLRQSFVNNRLAAGLDLNKPLCSIGTGQDALCRFATTGEILFGITLDSGRHLRFGFDAENGLDASFLKRLPDMKTAETYPDVAKLEDVALFNNGFQYVGASRWGGRSLFPKDSYAVEQQRQISSEEGQGELVAHFINKFGREDINDYCDGQAEDSTLLAQTIYWERKISPDVTIQTQPAGNSTNSFIISYGFKSPKPGGKSLEGLRAENVGFGISYALPVIVALLAAPVGGIVIIENPEAHLHPDGQAELAKLITRVAARGVQVLIETHSDHIITGIQLAAKANWMNPDNGLSKKDIVLNFITVDDRHCANVNPIFIESNGLLQTPPDGFFTRGENDLIKLYAKD